VRYRHGRARRTLRGIDERVAKGVNAGAGRAAIEQNRFIQLAGDAHTVNRKREARAPALAGLRATSPAWPPAPAARRCRTTEVQAGDHTSAAAHPLLSDLQAPLTKISNTGRGAH
jgi:hypothetical protein